MADDNVLIAIKAIDDASAALNKVASSLGALDTKIAGTQDEFKRGDAASNDFTRALTETGKAADNAGGGFSKVQAAIVTVNQAMQAAQMITGEVKRVYDSTIGETIKYAAQVKDLSETLSLSSEETSKLISIGQKFGVSTDTLTRSLEMMTKRGMAPTLDGLAKLADKVMAIKDPVERSATLVDLFGRNWTSLFPILEKGGSAIRNAADEAERFGNVLSGETVESAEKLQIEVNTLNAALDGLRNKLTKGLIPDLASSSKNLVTLVSVLDRTAKPVDALNYAIEVNTRLYGENSVQVRDLRRVLEEYQRENERVVGTVDAVDRAQSRAAASSAEWSRQLQAAQLAPTYDAVDRAIRRTADAAASLQKQIAAGAAQKFVLDVGISGRLVNETKQFTQSQSDLQKRLKDTEKELRDLESRQGAVDKTTIKNAMSANQLKLAYAQLAAMQGRLSKETDPTKQAELAAQIGIQQDRINGANSAVSSYIDNSKRIAELKGTHDEIIAKINEEKAAYDETNKHILYDYAQQAIAQQNARNGIAGMTEDQVNALNKLAVTWKIKSQADVDAMNQMLLAAKQLSSSNSLDQFEAIAKGALEGPKKPTDELIKSMQAMQKEAGDKMPKVATSISKIKPPAKEAFDQMAKLQIQTMGSGAAMQNMTQYGVIPMIRAMDLLAISLGTVNTQFGRLPTTLPTPLPTPTPLIPTTPYEGPRTRPLPGGAAKGANYIVPPGYPNDTYYQRVSSGEHVQVTPQGKNGMGGLNISKVEINVGGTNATIQQIQQAVWSEMTRVIEAAAR